MNQRTLILLLAMVLSIGSFSQTCITGGTPSAPVSYAGNNNFTISGLRIHSLETNPLKRPCIWLINCNNVTIENCVLGPSLVQGIKLVNCTNVTIRNNQFVDNGTGVLAEDGSGIKVHNNQFLNIKGPFPGGQCVQFVRVSGAGNEVNNNVSEQVPGNSTPEDLVNLYMSHGTALSPITVKGNKFRGGGPSPSGGGILAGDVGGSWQVLEENILVDPGQYGIAIATGHNNKILNNKVYGRQQPFTNTAYYAYNYYKPQGYTCSNYTVSGNQANWTNKNGYNGFPVYAGQPGDDDCPPVAGLETNTQETFGPEILPERLLCPWLVAHYPFNNNLADVSGSGLHASGSNVSYSVHGTTHSSAQFNGNAWITLPGSPWLRLTSNRLTVSAWIRPGTLQGIQAIATAQDSDGYSDGWRFMLNGGVINGRVTTTQGSQDVYGGTVQANVWNHVVMTYDGKNIKVYLNGQLQNTAALGGNIVQGNYAANMLIGHSRGTNYYFNGQIDEFKMYNGDLLPAEILQEYNNNKELVNKPRVLLAHYTFNGSWADQSGNNFTAGNSGAGFVCGGADAVSANFNGSALLSLPASLVLRPGSSRFLVSCWIKPSVVQGVQGIARSQDADGYNHGWRMVLLDNTFNGRLVTTTGSADVYCGGIQGGVWNHIALMYDGQLLRGYLNGNLVSATPITGFISYGASGNPNMWIGSSNGTSSFNGQIDEFKLYNGNIADEEVLHHYTVTSNAINNPPPCPLRVFVEETNKAGKPAGVLPVSFNIYPNPAVNEIMINAPTAFRATLYNAAGQVVLTGAGDGGLLKMAVGNCVPGIYVLRITSGRGMETRKVVIKR